MVVAFVSGKGGVGKTMLAVAFAKELSRATKTLLIDLDFFNRGLTGLLMKGPELARISRPDFLDGEDHDHRVTGVWRIIEVAQNLYHLSYPDLTPQEIKQFGTVSVEALRKSLEAFLVHAVNICSCECVVVDCHGGPDNSSFAVCLLADYCLLISEPDRITLYGTLNFLRQLDQVRGQHEVDIRLVFNKVIPAFSPFFLRALYRRRFSRLFGDRPLMGLIPLEVYLTKDFEKTPFLTSVYPYSYLARKIRVLIYDLFADRYRGLLPAQIRSMPKLMRWARRITLGRPFFLFDINFIMGTLVGVGIVHISLEQFTDGNTTMNRSILGLVVHKLLSWPVRIVDRYSTVILIIYVVVALLFCLTLFASWIRQLSRRFTYAVRLKQVAPTASYWLLAAILWIIPVSIVAGFLSTISDSSPNRILNLLVVEGAYALILLPELYRIYRDLRYEPHFAESLLRGFFLAYALSAPFVVKALFA